MDVHDGDKNVPAPYRFAWAGAWELRLWRQHKEQRHSCRWGGRAERGQECPRSLLLRFGGSMRGFASGGSIRSSDIPVAVGGRARRGQECPRSLPLRFGGSAGASLRRERERLRLGRQHKEQRHSCRWRGTCPTGTEMSPLLTASPRRSMRGFASGGSMRGFASGDSIRSSDIPVAGVDVPYGDRNVPAPYCFASAIA